MSDLLGGIHDDFQVLKPIQMKLNEQVIGHASSTISRLEEEIERLRKRIKELEAENNKRKVNDE